MQVPMICPNPKCNGTVWIRVEPDLTAKLRLNCGCAHTLPTLVMLKSGARRVATSKR